MAKRAFRPQVEPPKKEASYPTLEAVDSDRRAFLKRLGLGVLGVSVASGLMACGDRAVGDKETEPEGWDLSGVGPAPDGGPPPRPEPDAWQLGGARPEPDMGYPPPPDGGIAPQPDLEPYWDMSGVVTDMSPPSPAPDASLPQGDRSEVDRDPDQPPDGGAPHDALPGG